MLATYAGCWKLDGSSGVTVLATSAPHRRGIDDLRRAIAARRRQGRDPRAAGGRRLPGRGRRGSPRSAARPSRASSRPDRRELREALTDAAGVPVVVEAVRPLDDRARRRATGWPLTEWVARLKPDPLRRLHFGPAPRARTSSPPRRSSMPPANQVQKARVETAVRDLCDTVSRGLARPWVRSVRRASTSRFADLEDGARPGGQRDRPRVAGIPAWAGGARRCSGCCSWSRSGGAVWLGVLAATSYLQTPVKGTPDYRGVPVPTRCSSAVPRSASRRAGSRGWSRSLLARGPDVPTSSCARPSPRWPGEVVTDLIEAELAAYRAAYDGLADRPPLTGRAQPTPARRPSTDRARRPRSVVRLRVERSH